MMKTISAALALAVLSTAPVGATSPAASARGADAAPCSPMGPPPGYAGGGERGGPGGQSFGRGGEGFRRGGFQGGRPDPMRMFGMMDANHDGSVSRAEFQAFRDHRMEMRRERMGGRGFGGRGFGCPPAGGRPQR